MTLPLRSIPETIAASALFAQSLVPELTNIDENSLYGSFLVALAYVADHQQFLDLEVLAQTRLATCEGEDIDSFIAGDWNLPRLPGTASTGAVTFSRVSANNSAVIQPDTSLKTGDGTQTFYVVEDNTHVAWNPGLGGYFIGANVLSVTVPVIASTIGTVGNVQAGTITQITSPTPGVDAVVNGLAFTNGINQESDAAYKARFARYFSTLSKANLDSIKFAIDSTQQGLSYVVNENIDSSGVARSGHFSAWIDDGSGSPSSDLIARIHAAIDDARAVGITFSVEAAQPYTANVALTIYAQDGYTKASLVQPVKTAIAGYINTLKVGELLPYHTISKIALDSVEGVDRVANVLINGNTADITPSPVIGQVIRAGTVTVN